MSSLSSSSNEPPAVAGEFMLFGVRVVVDAMRKSVSLNNLSQYEQPQEAAAANNAAVSVAGAGKDDSAAPGYASENDVVHNSGGNRERERKRGIPWTEEEHKLFLVGLQKVGKGDWRGISRNFVKTRTPTQVASHAQKYFLRRSNHNRRRRRSSLFDITTDSVSAVAMEEEKVNNNNIQVAESQSHNAPTYPGGTVENPMQNPEPGHQKNPQIKNPPFSLSLNLNLSLPMDPRESSSSIHSAFHAMPGFINGENVIPVA